jgi:uncharacterized protein YdeI (YjbR/CyaY-like superfamily)
MSKQAANTKVDFYFEKEKTWKEEIKKLRTIVLECGLAEQLKWGCPCYTFEESNIVLIHTFKEYCAVLFFKGALLKDAEGVLVQQTKNVQSARQLRFTSAREVTNAKALLKKYVKEAVEVEKAGLKVSFKKPEQFVMAEEFQERLGESPALKKAFEGLTPGRQRGYLLYFSSAKQSKTRHDRVKKYIPKILKGKGLDD